MEDANLQHTIEPAIHISTSQQTDVVHNIMNSLSSTNKDPPKPNGSKPQLIIIPYQDESGHEKGFIQEVYQYPPGIIETIVEKKPPVSDESNLDRTCRRGEKKTQNLKNSSQGSVASSTSAVSGKSTLSRSKLRSGLPPHSHGLILHESNSTISSSGYEMPANPDHRHIIPVSFTKYDSDKLSDSSSNISTISDLSGYEDEYLAVKSFLAFGSNVTSDKKPYTLNEKSLNEKFYLKAKIEEQETTIKSLQSSKDELEIQTHRLATQLQNLMREKEICQQQLDVMMGKITEKNHQKYFELQKEKANLEGQYEALKIECQHSSHNNEQLKEKLYQQRIDIEKCEKEKNEFYHTSKKCQDVIFNLEKQNLRLEEELKLINETVSVELSSSLTLKGQLADKENSLKEMDGKVDAYLGEVKIYQDTINNLKKWNLEYAEREESQRLEKVKIENLLSDSTKRFDLLKENNEWYRVQLSKAQKLQSSLQNELTHSKNSLAMLSVERDRFKSEAERLNTEMEDSRVNAVREKASLLVQLEELEADMREREATISRLEKGDEGVYVKVSEERFRILEEDHKRLQELKIEVRDGFTYTNTLKEELKHKTLILKKHEETIHNLRKELVVTKEKEESKQLCIDSLTEKLNLTKVKLDESFEKIRKNEINQTQVKEQRLKLEVALSLSEEEKRHVDKTVVQLKEDMNKLSSSFFRMKHDLLAKDKQIETLSMQNSQLAQLEKELKMKTQIHTEQINKREYKKLLNETDHFKNACRKFENKNARLNDETCQLKKSLQSIEAERHSLSNSVTVRDEQITKLQHIIEAYKGKILSKEDELALKKDHFSNLEETYGNVQKKFNLLNNEYELICQERDDFRALEINKKNSISTLKECVMLEKQSKENNIKKYEDTLLELNETKELLSEKCNIIQNLNSSMKDFEQQKDSFQLCNEEIRKLNNILEIQTKQIFEQDNKIKSLSLNLEESNVALTSSEKKYVESINTKNSDIESLREILSSSQSEVEKLRAILAQKEEEHNVCESKVSNKFVNSFRNPKKPQSNKQVPHNMYNNINRASREEKREAESLRQKLKEISSVMACKEKEITALKAALAEQSTLQSQNNNLKSEVKKRKLECLTLKEKNDTVNDRCVKLQENLEQSYSDLNKKEKDCSEWQRKYQNLMDVIPQRDTDQSIDGDQWQVLNSLKDPSHRLIHPHPRVDMAKVEESLRQDCNLEECVQFTKTMAYLQNQISLTAETLQNKDRQIIELNEKLTVLSTSSKDNFQRSQYITHLGAAQDSSESLKRSQAETNRSSCEVISSQCVTDQHVQLKSESVDVPPNEKEAQWKEKQRRYESNVRLLTRKLKEHMKGRRAAEKEVGIIAQQHRKNLEAEDERYQALKNKFLDLEKESQQLQSELSSCEKTKIENEFSLHKLKDELENERKAVLELQKKNGQIEEVKHSLDTLRTRNNSLMTELSTKNRELTEKGEVLQKTFFEKLMLKDTCQSLTTHMEELKKNLADEHLKVVAKDKDFTKKQEEINEKIEEVAHLMANHASLQFNHDELQESLKRVRSENDENCKRKSQFAEEIERLSKCVDAKSVTVKDLTAKKDILERELKMKDESVESLRMDSEGLKKRLMSAEQKCDSSTVLLRKKIVEMKELELSLNEKVSTVHKERMVYQSQCTQLKVALNSALEKLQASSELRSLPSPSPLNTETLTTLMEQCSKPPPSTGRLMASLTERLSCLREEVWTLQSEIKARDQSQQHDTTSRCDAEY